MKVGVYIDGYNTYHGGLSVFSGTSESWKWLDFRSLVASILPETSWATGNVEITKILYCTARTKSNAGHERQRAYISALFASKSITHVEYGKFVHRYKRAKLATEKRNRKPDIVNASNLPADLITLLEKHAGAIQVNNKEANEINVLVGIERTEEKGSDVNLATHLLVDVVSGQIDGAIVISNDSDLRTPIQEVRKRVPVGIINPRNSPTVKDLQPTPEGASTRNWTRKLNQNDYLKNQLPDTVESFYKPKDW